MFKIKTLVVDWFIWFGNGGKFNYKVYIKQNFSNNEIEAYLIQSILTFTWWVDYWLILKQTPINTSFQAQIKWTNRNQILKVLAQYFCFYILDKVGVSNILQAVKFQADYGLLVIRMKLRYMRLITFSSTFILLISKK